MLFSRQGAYVACQFKQLLDNGNLCVACIQDKINAFWEISKKELEDTKAQLRNKDREMEELEERHQVEIKVIIIHMLHGCRPLAFQQVLSCQLSFVIFTQFMLPLHRILTWLLPLQKLMLALLLRNAAAVPQSINLPIEKGMLGFVGVCRCTSRR